MQERRAAPRDHALRDGRAYGIHRVAHTILALRDLRFAGTADPDQRHAAGKRRQPSLEPHPLAFRGSLLQLGPDRRGARSDRVRAPLAADQDRLVPTDGRPPCPAEPRERHVLELLAELRPYHLRPDQRGNVVEQRLAFVARRLDGCQLQPGAQLVDHQGRQRLALHLIGNDQQRRARPGDLLE